MQNPLIKITKHSSIFALGNVLTKSVSFLLFPLYTNFLAPKDYGRLEILMVTMQILLIFCGFGVGSGLRRVLLYDTKNKDEQKLAVTSAAIFMFVTSSIIFGLTFYLLEPLVLTFSSDLKAVGLFRLAMVVGFLNANSIVPQQIYLVEFQSTRFTAINLGKFSLTLCLNIYFVAILLLAVQGILFSQIISAILALVVNLYFIRSYILFAFSTRFMKKCLRVGLPFMPAALALWIITSMDRWFLAHYWNEHEIGLYAVGFRIALILQFILREPFEKNWPSIYFRLAKQPNAQKQLSSIFTYYVLAASSIGLALAVFAQPIIFGMTTVSFHPAWRIVPILLIGILFRGMADVLGVGIGISGKTEFYAIAAAVAAVANLFLNFILVPKSGIMGASIATAISFFIMQIVVYLFSNRLYSIQYEFKRLSKILLAVTIAAFLKFNSPWVTGKLGLGVSFFSIFSFALILWGINFFQKDELMEVKRLLKFKKVAK